jgi:hypothetical protein
MKLTNLITVYPYILMPAKISHYYFERVKLKSVNSPEQDSVSLPLASQKPAKKLATLDPADLAVPEPGQEVKV